MPTFGPDHQADDRDDRLRLPKRTSPVLKVYDGPFDYHGLSNIPSRCHLRIYGHPDQPVLVVATEFPDNPGTSITNSLPGLMDDVCAAFDIDPDMLLWVEHYPANVLAEESVEGVEFRRDGTPAWVPMSRTRLEELVGEPLTTP